MSVFRPYSSANDTRHRLSRRCCVVLLFAAVVAAGCGVKQVTVKDRFPTPVMQKFPHHIGLYMDDSFRNYVYTEKLPGGGDWSVDLGAANVGLFQQILTGMFARVSAVPDLHTTGDVEAVVQPSIEDYQFSTPDQNQTEFFEAWIKYRIRFFDPAGKLLAEWPLTAYGRSESRFLDKKASLRDATKTAMRDAAAAMALDFDQHPVVRAFLYGPQSKSAVVHREGANNAS